MNVNRSGFFGRLRLLLRLIGSSIFSRRPATQSSSWRSRSPRPPIADGPLPVLTDLLGFISVAQTQSAAGIDVTIFSLESFQEGFIVHGRFSAKYGERDRENRWSALPVFTAVDDLGHEYQWWPASMGANRFESVFAPALDSNARQLTLTVTEMRWTFFEQQRQQIDEGPWIFTVPLS